VNAKLAGLNKLLMEENERLSKHSLQLTLENHVLRQELQQMPAASLGGIRNQLDHVSEIADIYKACMIGEMKCGTCTKKFSIFMCKSWSAGCCLCAGSFGLHRNQF
jgi:hypothetical protein